MPTYTLELELYSVLNASTSDFEIWTDGSQLGGGHTVTSSGTILIDPAVFYAGSLPTSLEFRFDDAVGATVDQIEIRSVKINDRYVNTGNYLSTSTLNDGGSSTVNITNADFIFNSSSEPLLSEFTTGATRTLTAGADTVRVFQGSTQEIFDALAGRDVIFLGSGDDKVFGNDGNDYIRAGAGADLISGGDDNDLIYGQDGDDELYGGNGNDRLHGGNDNDEIHGGAGNDRLNGNAGNDTITGGDDDDRIGGGAGNDDLFGDDGADILSGGAGTDTLDGGAGNDLLYGGADDDIMHGGDDDDTLVGDTGDDTLHGDDGDDVLNGRADDDTLFGGTGDDILTGEDGVDTLHGGDDADVLIGGDGADTLNGDDGNDVLHGSGLTATEIATILNANPNVVFSAATNSFYEFVVDGAITWLTAQTTAAASLLSGTNGHLATVSTLAELNYLDSQVNPTNDANSGSYFTSGSEIAVANEWRFTDGIESGVQFWQGDSSGSAVNGFSDMWAGGQPNDASQNYVYLWSASDGLADGNNTQSFTHNEGYLIEWDAGTIGDDNAIDTLNGGGGDDHLYGYGGADILNGDAGVDILFGGAGDDTLDAGTGNDVLMGGADDDTLIGGTGDDTMDGGTGTDTVDFSGSAGAITANLITGTATGNGTDTLSNIENVIGSSGNDTITGSDTAHTINGGAGDDVISGGEQIRVPVNAGNLVTYGGSQDGGGTVTYLDDDVGVEFDSNNWKQILGTYTITANTILEFDFRSTIEAEVTGIGFDTDNGISSNRTFEIFGTQTWGIQAFNTYGSATLGDWVHFEIDVGSYYTGTFSRLIFANDDDGNSPANGTNGNGFFRNIVIHEGSAGDNSLIGGDGADELYGDGGLDTFIFEDTNDVDTIHYFNTQDGDELDISNILTNFVVGTSDIDDYVNFTNSSDHVTMSVDVNGTTGGANFVDIAELRGQADLDESTLYTNGNIIV